MRLLYVRSYLWLRLAIGLLGIALPVVLWASDSFLARTWRLQGSISGYYYTGSREIFVGSISAIAIFLVAYKVAERDLDNLLSLAAGVFAALVALCATERPDDSIMLTPIQLRFGETAVTVVHYGSAIAFLGCLAGLCWIFGDAEGRRPPKEGKRSPTFWRRFHHGCASGVGIGLLLCLLSLTADWPPLFWPEALCVWAFGLSWTIKGAELDILFAKVDPLPTMIASTPESLGSPPDADAETDAATAPGDDQPRH